MTVVDAINRIDSLKPNVYEQPEKIRWLSELDGMVKHEIIDTHEGGEDIEWSPYDSDSLDTELLIPAPYDEVYISWLEAMIDYNNAEYNRYNNSMAMFRTKYDAYFNRYNRANMPKGRSIRYY